MKIKQVTKLVMPITEMTALDDFFDVLEEYANLTQNKQLKTWVNSWTNWVGDLIETE